MGKRCLNPNIHDQEKENQICYANYTEAEFEASMKHTSVPSLFQGPGLSQDKSTSAKVEEDAAPRVSSGSASALPSSGSSVRPLAWPPRSTSVSITPRRGLSPPCETAPSSDESQQPFQPSPSKSLAAKPSEVGPPSVLESIMIYNSFTVSTEAQSRDSKNATQFPQS